MSKKYLANKDNVYTKVDTDNFLAEKANKSEVYTKLETDNAITSKVAEIVADAPEDFNTLKEMSDWISSHENDASAMNSAIQTNATNISDLQTGKVDKSSIDKNYGLALGETGKMFIYRADDTHINLEANNYRPIVPSNIPLVMSNYGITSKTQITEMQEDIKNKVDNDIFVAENLIKYPYAQMVESRLSVQFTYDDGMITLNGISNDGSTDTIITMNLYTHFTLKDGKYTLSANSSSSKIGVRFYGHDANSNASILIKTVYGSNSFVYDTTNDGYNEYSLNLRVLNNYNETEFVNDTCKPMFEIGNVAHAYQPYKLSRKAMRDDIDSLMALLTNKG